MQYLIAGGGKFGTRSLRKLHIAHKRKGYHVESILVVDRDPGCRAAKYIARVPRRSSGGLGFDVIGGNRLASSVRMGRRHVGAGSDRSAPSI